MLSCVRGFLGALCLMVFLLLKKKPLRPQFGRKTLWILILTGAMIAMDWILLFEAYRYTSVPVATLCYYMQPTILILLSPLVFRERLTGKKLFCAVLSALGMLFVSGALENGGIGIGDLLGIACGLASAALYAIIIMINKKLRIQDAFVQTIIQLTAAAVTVLPYLLLTEDFSQIRLSTAAILLVLLLGIFHTGITYVAYFQSLNGLNAQSIAVLSYLDPLVAVILSAIFLQEQLSLPGIVGMILMIGSALFCELSPNRAEAAGEERS